MKTPNFKSLSEIRDKLAEEYHGLERGNWGPDFATGFNAGIIERDKQWKSKVSNLISKLKECEKYLSMRGRETYQLVRQADGSLKTEFIKTYSGILADDIKSSLAEFYGYNKGKFK